MRVVVFGGANPKPGDPVYEQALVLGKLLGSAGHTLLNGGYSGTMEAVSRGASEAGGHVIGVTCDEIESWRKSGANSWVNEEWRCGSLDERIRKMIDHCDAAIALPGGVGTLTEIMTYWNRLVIHSMTLRPLIAIGHGWKDVINIFIKAQKPFFAEDDAKWIVYADDVQSAFDLLRKDMV